MNEDDADDEREFPPAEGIVFRLDRVTDDLETVERLVAAGKIPASDDERRRMRALLEKFFLVFSDRPQINHCRSI